MAMAPQETPSKRARHVTYHDQGWGYKKIAEKFNTSIKQVRDAIYIARDTGRVYNRAKSGRPPSLTPRAQ